MSKIDIRARHQLDREAAQEAADDLSRDLAEKFAIEWGWDGDTIHFERPGVQGQIDVTDEIIHVQAHLGFLLALLKGPIEDEVTRYLREHFGCEV